jgi:hypothetical protein
LGHQFFRKAIDYRHNNPPVPYGLPTDNIWTKIGEGYVIAKNHSDQGQGRELQV